ncbi:RNA-binding protein rnc1 [Zancudomyces culisetae]|uniref:RNA-binding protein rnc1 n=1 Tax=Zancudomyces culisetae TaxID=1213189 RepID=A0A1R1PUW6_ZANCU|nr:RNA-binding protein rnc1 [Zancudomyces culisetae]|eukprot:OMH84765.1 RNA-binding protein rnc1 [Zancudomyces culisetae]
MNINNGITTSYESGAFVRPERHPVAQSSTSTLQEDAYFTESKGKGGKLALRALVTCKEAGVIIGKSGSRITDLRGKYEIKANVSKLVPGSNNRILTITGNEEMLGNAFYDIAQILSEFIVVTDFSKIKDRSFNTENLVLVRLLVSHLMVGTIIGKQGLNIHNIQHNSNTRIVSPKGLLPQSTERVVEIYGRPDGIKLAVQEISRYLMGDSTRSYGTVHYNPELHIDVDHYSSLVKINSTSLKSTSCSTGGISENELSIGNRRRAQTTSFGFSATPFGIPRSHLNNNGTQSTETPFHPLPPSQPSQPSLFPSSQLLTNSLAKNVSSTATPEVKTPLSSIRNFSRLRSQTLVAFPTPNNNNINNNRKSIFSEHPVFGVERMRQSTSNILPLTDDISQFNDNASNSGSVDSTGSADSDIVKYKLGNINAYSQIIRGFDDNSLLENRSSMGLKAGSNSDLNFRSSLSDSRITTALANNVHSNHSGGSTLAFLYQQLEEEKRKLAGGLCSSN